MEQARYDVFISYSRKDYVDEHKNVIPGNEVSKIKEALTEAGIKFWMDEKGIVPGEDYAEKILQHIKACNIFLFLSSTAANQSEWTRKEIACALAYKKEVIPLLLDDSPFHDSIMLRIVDLDRIDYYVNPEKGLEKLLMSINTHLNKLAKEEEQRKEQQKQLVEDIRTTVKELNIEETKLDLERNKLLVKTEKVVDKMQRESLKTEITDSSPIRKKSQAEIKKLQEQMAKLKTERDSFEEKNKAYLKELADKGSESAMLSKEVDSKEQNRIVSKPNNNKLVHVIYGLIILILTSVICIRSCGKQNSIANNTNGSMSLTQEAVIVDSILEFLVDSVKFKMIMVEGGSFLMGAQKTDPSGQNYDIEANDDEKPVHEVKMDTYYMGETVVTQALWKAVMGSSDNQQHEKANPEWRMRGEGDDFPVYCVSWDECQEFINKLNMKTGKSFRLPTEAEWEFAARGGNKSMGCKYAGGNVIGEVAWYGDNSDDKTHPVKGKKPNELGLYDMSGNVWEWCQDWYESYSDSEQNNPTGPSNGSNRVLRGGSWFNFAKICRVSYRSYYVPDLRHLNHGLRLVLPQQSSSEQNKQ